MTTSAPSTQHITRKQFSYQKHAKKDVRFRRGMSAAAAPLEGLSAGLTISAGALTLGTTKFTAEAAYHGWDLGTDIAGMPVYEGLGGSVTDQNRCNPAGITAGCTSAGLGLVMGAGSGIGTFASSLGVAATSPAIGMVAGAGKAYNSSKKGFYNLLGRSTPSNKLVADAIDRLFSESTRHFKIKVDMDTDLEDLPSAVGETLGIKKPSTDTRRVSSMSDQKKQCNLIARRIRAGKDLSDADKHILHRALDQYDRYGVIAKAVLRDVTDDNIMDAKEQIKEFLGTSTI